MCTEIHTSCWQQTHVTMHHLLLPHTVPSESDPSSGKHAETWARRIFDVATTRCRNASQRNRKHLRVSNTSRMIYIRKISIGKFLTYNSVFYTHSMIWRCPKIGVPHDLSSIFGIFPNKKPSITCWDIPILRAGTPLASWDSRMDYFQPMGIFSRMFQRALRFVFFFFHFRDVIFWWDRTKNHSEIWLGETHKYGIPNSWMVFC